MSRQPFYDADPYEMQNRTDSFPRDQGNLGYMADRGQFFADERDRFPGEIDRFGERRNQNFSREVVDTFEYSHSQNLRSSELQQSFDRGASLGSSYDSFGGSNFKDDRGSYLERSFGHGTGFISAGIDRDPLPFQRSEMFDDTRLSAVGGYGDRFGEGDDRMRGFQNPSSPPRRQWDSLKRPYDDSSMNQDNASWSSSEPKYRQMAMNRMSGFESKPSMGSYGSKFGSGASNTAPPVRKFAAAKFDSSQKFTPSSKFSPNQFSSASFGNRPKPPVSKPSFPSGSGNMATRKSTIHSAPLKSAMKPSAPVKPLGISNQGNKPIIDKKKEVPKTTSQLVGKTDIKAACPWINAQEITEEELKEKFPKATLQKMEENCLKGWFMSVIYLIVL